MKDEAVAEPNEAREALNQAKENFGTEQSKQLGWFKDLEKILEVFRTLQP